MCFAIQNKTTSQEQAQMPPRPTKPREPTRTIFASDVIPPLDNELSHVEKVIVESIYMSRAHQRDPGCV